MKTKICTQCGIEKPIKDFYNCPYGDYRNTCSNCVRLLLHCFRKTKNVKIKLGKSSTHTHKRNKIYRSGLNYHLKEWAHCIVYILLQEGLILSKSCEICNKEYVHAHHIDYNKPLDVHWLCPKHHFAWHICKLEL